MYKEELARIATLYYIDGLTQEELSRMFSISRATVGRMLRRALQEGIVEIRVRPNNAYAADLERALVEEAYRHSQDHGIRYGLMTCAPSFHSLFEYYGFREYLPPAILRSGDAVLRMALVMDDEAHLRACDSPLQYLVRNPAAGEAARNWLLRTFKLGE